MAGKSYVVTAACAVLYNEDRSAAVTVARGGQVPAGTDPAHIELLLERGMIAEGEPVGGVESDPDAAPPFVPDADSDGKSARRSSPTPKDA